MPQFVLLYPASLIGLALLALPVAAHLISRQTRRVIVFPTTDRLPTAAPLLASWRSVRDLLVLVLRCLIVALLVLAAGNLSCMRHADPQTPSNSRPVVLLIDDHLTTQLRTEAGSVFAQLQQMADEELAGRSADAAVVWSTRQRDTAAWRTDVNVARAAVMRQTPAYLDADMPTAWRTVQRLVHEQSQPCDVVVLTDRTADAWPFALRSDRSLDFPPGTRVSLRSATFDELANVALARPVITPSLGSALEPRTISATLRHQGNEAVRVTVRLNLQGAASQSREVALPPDSETAVSFEFMPTAEGDTLVQLQIGDDAFTPDNELLAVCRVATHPRVLVVAQPEHQLTARRLQLAAATTGDDGNGMPGVMTSNTLTASTLAHVDHVLLLLDDALPVATINTLQQFVLEGGQLMIWPTGDRTFMSDAWPRDWPRLSDQARLGETRIDRVDARHPVTRIFIGPSEAALQRTIFKRWRDITVDASATLPLTYADGSPAAVVQSIGAGRLLVVSFDIDANASMFARTGSFVAILRQAMATHARAEMPVASDVGKPVELSAPWAARTGTLSTPSGVGTDDITITQAGNIARITLPLATKPGRYTWQFDGNAVALAAVNISASKTRFDRLPPDALLQALSDTVDMDATQTAASTSTASIAWLCFVLALSCMAGELLLAMRRDG